MRRAPLVLVATTLAAFTATLDNTVVAVALRDLQADLGSSVLGLQGVVTAYTVALAGLLFLGGALVDVLGARRVLVVGTVLFGGASVLCATASAVPALVASRAVQGAGAALLLPGSLAVLASAYPDPVRRRRVLAVWAAVTGAALVAGPVVGGELVARSGWPAVFWVNLPLCALVLVAAAGAPATAPSGRRLDVPGAVLSCVVLGTGTYGVVLAGRDGISLPVLGLVGLAVLAGIALRWSQRRTADPLLPREVFADRQVRGALLAAFGTAVAVFVLMVFVSLFLQLVQDRDARQAGRVLLALPLGLILTAAATSRWRAVRLPVVVGLVVAAAGLGGLGLAVREDVPALVVAGWLLLVGVGAGLTTAPVVSTTLTATGEDRSGLASASVTAARELGGVVAVGGLGALAVSRLTERLTEAMVSAGVPPGSRSRMLDALLSADKPEVRRQLVDSVGAVRTLDVYQRFEDTATASFVTSTRVVLGGAAVVLVLLAAVVARQLPRRLG